MRKAFLLSAVAGSALLAANAMADVTVTGTVDICTVQTPCHIVFTEDLTKRKTVTIDVDIDLAPLKFAEAWSHFNQRNDHNRACENCAEKQALIVDSIGSQGALRSAFGNVGITSVNQSAGNNINQATIISFALDEFTPPVDPPGPPTASTGGFAESQVAGEQIVTTNTVRSFNIAFRDALITNSIRGNVGVTAVNQAAGNIYNQANAISAAVSLLNGVALSDAALGQFVVNNTHNETNISKHAFATDSITHNIGVTQVNQSAGNLGNQSNVLSLAVTFTP